MKIKVLFVSFFLVFFLSCSFRNKVRVFKYTHFALGTVIDVSILTEEGSVRGVPIGDTVSAVVREVFRIFDEVDSAFYEGNRKSGVYRFNNLEEGKYILVSRDLFDLIRRSIKVSEKTGGLFDITAGTYLPLYTFDGENKKAPDKDSLKFLSRFAGYSNVILDTVDFRIARKNKYLRLSVGGIAKGYAVDRAIDFIRKYDFVKGAIVNAGGDIGLLPRKDGELWRIGIRHPRRPGELLGVVELREKAIATSGDYEKFYVVDGKRYHHILDPATGWPVYRCQSATVIAPKAEIADALATGLFVAGPEVGKRTLKSFPGCYALWVDSAGNVHMSEGFEKYLKERYW